MRQQLADGTIIRRNRKCYRTNPSIPTPGAIARTRRRQRGKEQTGYFVTDGNNRELLGPGVAVMYALEEVDAERFVKIYAEGMHKTMGLTKAGHSVFAAVFAIVREHPGKDEIILTYEEVAPILSRKLSRPTFFRGLGELVKQEILYPGVIDGLYFIDVNCMFNGDRFALVKAYQLKGTQTELPLDMPAIEQAKAA